MREARRENGQCCNRCNESHQAGIRAKESGMVRAKLKLKCRARTDRHAVAPVAEIIKPCDIAACGFRFGFRSTPGKGCESVIPPVIRARPHELKAGAFQSRGRCW